MAKGRKATNQAENAEEHHDSPQVVFIENDEQLKAEMVFAFFDESNKRIKARKIKEGELPPGFDIKKYVDARQFNTADWWALAFRKRSDLYWSWEDEINLLGDEKGWLSKLNILLDNPLQIGVEPGAKDVYSPLPKRDPASTDTVWPLTLEKAYLLRELIDEKNLMALQLILEHQDRDEKDEDTLHEAFDSHRRAMEEPFWDHLGHLVVDLRATDDDIRQDFKTWLSEFRKLHEVQPKFLVFQTGKMETWAKDHVLAYMDLYLWAGAQNAVFTDTVMGEALFSPTKNHTGEIKQKPRSRSSGLRSVTFNTSGDVKDRRTVARHKVKDSTRPEAEKMLLRANMLALEAQAAADLAGRTRKYRSKK